MNAVKELFSRIGKRKVEKQAQGWPEYKSLLVALARGEDVDPDHAKLLIEAMGKSQDDLAKDVTAMEKRISAVVRHRQHQEAAKQIGPADQELAGLQAKLAEAHRKYDPLIRDAQSRRQAIEAEMTATAGAEKELVNTCLDPAILEREKELRSEVAQYHPRRQQLQEQFEQSRAAWAEMDRAFRKWEQETRTFPTSQYEKDQLSQCQARRDTFARNRDAASAELATIDQRCKAINQELDKLRQQKLAP